MVTFTYLFALIFLAHADPETIIAAPETVVRAAKLRATDEVTYDPHRVSIEQPGSDVHLGESLSRLPGVVVRNVSGLGSATTVITSQALGSAGTLASFDDIPILEPTGRGLNFSVFPVTLVSGIDHVSPFYPSVDFMAPALASSGGRINIRPLRAPLHSERTWKAGVIAGTANSVQGSGSFQLGSREQSLTTGVTGYNTDGGYAYVNPDTKTGERRLNNNSTGASALVQYKLRPRRSSELSVFNLSSLGERTNPGRIDYPSRDHEKDLFNSFGVSYRDPELFSKRQGGFARASSTYSRTTLKMGPPIEDYDTRSFGQYVETGYAYQTRGAAVGLTLDNQYGHLKSNLGKFKQNVTGVTATSKAEVGPVQFVPRVRHDIASQYENTTSYSASMLYVPRPELEFALSYGIVRLFPEIIARSGFRSGGYTLLPNDRLKVQRDSLTSFAVTCRGSVVSFSTSLFYDLIRDRATFAGVSPTESQFLNASSVSALGGIADVQVFLLDHVVLRSSVTSTRAWDRTTGHEIPYKPRIEGLVSASYSPLADIAVTVQEQFTGKHYISFMTDETVAPFAQTHLRLDVAAFGGTAFARVSNLLNRSGFENPGFPNPGRAFWVGYATGSGNSTGSAL